MGIVNLIGFQTVNSVQQTSACTDEAAVRSVKIQAFVNVLGYIPLLGILGGAIRIDAAMNRANKFSSNDQIYMVVRGIFEILGAGSLFLIPDLAVTAWRFRPGQETATA